VHTVFRISDVKGTPAFQTARRTVTQYEEHSWFWWELLERCRRNAS